MKKISFVIGLALVGRAAFSLDGKVEIVGRGLVEKAPEFVEMQVRVTSLCYDKPMVAQEENAGLAKKILSVMKTYVRTEKDKLIASGGHTIRQTEYTSDDDGQSKILCERKWRTSNVLTLQTEDIASVAAIQEKFLEALASDEGMSSIEKQQTYAELEQPTFAVYPETYSGMKKEAQGKAWMDALGQFNGFLNQCKLQNAKLAQISEPEYFGLAKSAPLNDEVGAPIIPDSISVSATWKFVWSFDPTACYR
ncbi:MAG: SIMPL domain-containing protein [Pseudomonadota bacterium]